jgi:dTDP-6-deoxy-L-talose 4-dehydrogenase (NAD+)
MTNILITGASGFVGMQVMKALDNLTNVNLFPIVRIKKKNIFKKFNNVKNIYFTKDIFNETENWWKKKLLKIDIVIHIAWYTEHGNYLDSELNIDCLYGSLRLGNAVAKSGVKRFIGIGTCLEYDLTKKKVTVNTALDPKNLYSITKVALFTSLQKLFLIKKKEFVWCRLFYLFGEGEDERRLSAYTHKQLQNGLPVKLTSGYQIRDFLNVCDAAKIISKISLDKNVGVVNICSEKPISVKKFAETIANKYGRLDLLKFGKRKKNLYETDAVWGIMNYDKT